jgi:NAD(P)-dependent dehydrogenase (short-subunit alcohol dehydrogenase family)
MNGALKDQTVLVIGRGSGLARASALAALDAGARVVAAGRERETLAAAYAGEPGVSAETVDLTDEASIAALGDRLGATSAPATPPGGSARPRTSPRASCSP